MNQGSYFFIRVGGGGAWGGVTLLPLKEEYAATYTGAMDRKIVTSINAYLVITQSLRPRMFKISENRDEGHFLSPWPFPPDFLITRYPFPNPTKLRDSYFLLHVSLTLHLQCKPCLFIFRYIQPDVITKYWISRKRADGALDCGDPLVNVCVQINVAMPLTYTQQTPFCANLPCLEVSFVQLLQRGNSIKMDIKSPCKRQKPNILLQFCK